MKALKIHLPDEILTLLEAKAAAVGLAPAKYVRVWLTLEVPKKGHFGSIPDPVQTQSGTKRDPGRPQKTQEARVLDSVYRELSSIYEKLRLDWGSKFVGAFGAQMVGLDTAYGNRDLPALLEFARSRPWLTPDALAHSMDDVRDALKDVP